jgi:putative pyruvate formate lyase activating enzyme
MLTSNELQSRAAQLKQLLQSCNLCPHNCGINRLEGEKGSCGLGAFGQISSFGPHFGEEHALVGARGSGTIFFSGCNLGCVFCQNWDISTAHSRECEPDELALVFLTIQREGCHNVNLVTPTPQIHAIVEALSIAVEAGFNLPLIYNCGGYEQYKVLQLLDGIFDIYMPDLKTLDPRWSRKFLNAPDYPEVVEQSIMEMFRQVGHLKLVNGIAVRGMLVRHLIMPYQTQDALHIIHFLHDRFGSELFLNLMTQYHPCHMASRHASLSRRISPEEWMDARMLAQKLKITRGLEQHL